MMNSLPRLTSSWRGLLGALLIQALPVQASNAAEPFEGVWAISRKECRDADSPTSRTLIDLGNIIAGKPVPIFDQYENHCKIGRKAVVEGTTTLTATCFEFWENFTKGVEGRKTTINLAPGQNGTLKINGKPYRRCAAKGTSR